MQPDEIASDVLDACRRGRRGDGEPATGDAARRRRSGVHCVPRPRRPSVAARSLALARSHQCRPPSTKSAIAAASSTGMSPCTLCPASANRTTRSIRETAQQLGLVGVVDDRLRRASRGRASPGRRRRRAPPTAAPSSRCRRRRRTSGESCTAIAPAPRTIVELFGVVQDAATQRRLACASGCARSSGRGSRRSWRTSPDRGRSR